MSSNPAIPDPAAQRAAMIAHAERTRARLEELAEVGMALAKEIAVRFIDGPYHPEPRLDPGRSYAAAARSVRLTFTLEAEVDETILALCSGEFPVATSASPPKDVRATPWFEGLSRRGPRPADSTLNDPARERDGSEPEIECLVDREHSDDADVWSDRDILPGALDFEAAGIEAAGVDAEGDRAAGDHEHPPEDADPEHRAVSPPRSRPEGASRPPHFERGRHEAAAAPVERSGADPPSAE